VAASACNTYVGCVMGSQTQSWGYTFHEKVQPTHNIAGFTNKGNLYCTSSSSHQIHTHSHGDASTCAAKCAGSCNAIAVSATACNTYSNCVMSSAAQSWGYTFYVRSPVDCVVGSWGEWGACNNPCKGTKSRSRSVTRPAAYGGAACPALTTTEDCSSACPSEAECDLINTPLHVPIDNCLTCKKSNTPSAAIVGTRFAVHKQTHADGRGKCTDFVIENEHQWAATGEDAADFKPSESPSLGTTGTKCASVSLHHDHNSDDFDDDEYQPKTIIKLCSSRKAFRDNADAWWFAQCRFVKATSCKKPYPQNNLSDEQCTVEKKVECYRKCPAKLTGVIQDLTGGRKSISDPKYAVLVGNPNCNGCSPSCSDTEPCRASDDMCHCPYANIYTSANGTTTVREIVHGSRSIEVHRIMAEGKWRPRNWKTGFNTPGMAGDREVEELTWEQSGCEPCSGTDTQVLCRELIKGE